MNEYNAAKGRVFLDAWIYPLEPAANIRNVGRRLITRMRRGQRIVKFQLELKDAAYSVGQLVTITTRNVLSIAGLPVLRQCLIVSRTEVAAAVAEYEAVDLEYGGLFARISSDTATDDYDTATAAEKAAGYYWGDANNRLGTVMAPGAIFW